MAPDISNARRAAGARVRGLYAITPDLHDTQDLLSRTMAAIAGGARVIQYRNKTASAERALEHALALRALTSARGAIFIVNDDIELAQIVDADGVHVGRTDQAVAQARKALGERAVVGASCYDSLALASAAVGDGADYVAFGSFFPSATKPGAAHAGIDLLRQARAKYSLPIVAIGGIDAGNAQALIDAGADALAVISALYGAADIEAAARSIASLFAQEPPSSDS